MSTDESKQEDTKTNNGQASTPEQISEYKRKKNWISGVDNDLVVLGVAGTALAVAGALAFPQVKEWVSNITNKNQQAPPPPPPIVEEPYIPPTPPQPVVEPAPQPVQEQEQQQQETNEIPDTFYDDELQKRRQLLTGRKHLKYDSQFGAGIANS